MELAVSSEKYIIGCLIKDHPYTRKLASNIGLESDHFESSTCRTIWSVAEELHSRGQGVDAASVIETIESKGKHLDAQAAGTYVMESMTIATTTQSLAVHADIVMEKHTRRTITGRLTDAIAAIDAGESIENTTAAIKQGMARIAAGGRETITRADRIKNMMHRYKNVRSKGCSGIKSRWNSIQQHTAGYPFGKLTVLGARPKMGKSTFALNEAVFTAMVEKVPTLIFSLEMDEEELLEKAGSDITEIDNLNLKLGRMSQQEIEHFVTHGPEIISQAPLYIEDHPGQTVERICAKIREYAVERKVRFVVVDYVQLIAASPVTNKFQSRTYEIAHMTNELRIAAKETGVAILLLSQISRPFKNRDNPNSDAPMPELHDLKDSGSIEQDAYIVMFIGHPTATPPTRPSWVNPNITPCTIRVAANRGGSTGDIHMMFNKPHNKFFSQTEFQNFLTNLNAKGK